MYSFKNKFPEDTIEIGGTLEDLPLYLKLIKKIENDDLYPSEERFKNMMNHQILHNIVHFQQSLEQQETKIKEDIDELNQSLNQLRSYFPHVIALMMEEETLTTFADFIVVDSSGSKAENLAYLTKEENKLLAYLFLHKKRLEQEHISQNYVNNYLASYI